jgi:hypothetical protein
VNLKLSDDIIFFFSFITGFQQPYDFIYDSGRTSPGQSLGCAYDTHHHFDHLQFDFRRASTGHQLEEQELLFIN